MKEPGIKCDVIPSTFDSSSNDKFGRKMMTIYSVGMSLEPETQIEGMWIVNEIGQSKELRIVT